MNEQFYTPNRVERTDQNTDGPVANADPFADKASVDAALIHEPLVDEVDAVVRPIDEAPLNQNPVGDRTADKYKMIKTTLYEAPKGETIPNEAPIGKDTGSLTALLNREESEHFRTRWNEIQGQFVDEPRLAVQQADGLVSEVIEQITQMFASEHSVLEGQWKQGTDVSTEDLRKALQRYRSFFNRLVV